MNLHFSYKLDHKRFRKPLPLPEIDPDIQAYVNSLFRSSGGKQPTEEDIEELLGVIDDVQGFKEKGGDIPRYISRKHIMDEFAKATKLKGKLKAANKDNSYMF